MKVSSFRFFGGVMVFALMVFLSIQIYWFSNSYKLNEKQFDNKVNLALRKVSDRILRAQGDVLSSISAVRQTASNEYFVSLNRPLEYALLDSLVKVEFQNEEIEASYHLMIYTKNDSLVLGNFFMQGAKTSPQGACVGREQDLLSPMNFAVMFPEKKSLILGSLDIWIFSAGTFALILLVCMLIVMELSKRKKFAELKNDFISNMTHELQTPIANISMASEILINQPELQKRERYLQIIQEENQRLKKQVESVLQVAIMGKGDLVIQRKNLNLHQLLEGVIRNFEVRINSRKGSIQTKLNAADASIEGDPFHLTNIFYNLLDNADKYSIHTPEIIVSSEQTEKGLYVSIADKGIGIGRDVQKFVFDRFYRVQNGNIHNTKGFGLGLTYVKNIIQAHNGVITLQSELNQGSRFELFFPRSKTTGNA
jgi:two-component system phosphate regulon sensor histidine kinase PhoR